MDTRNRIFEQEQSEHSRRCERFFSQIRFEKEPVFFRLDHDPEDMADMPDIPDGGDYIQFSVLTQEILNYDASFFSTFGELLPQEARSYDYKPYFVSFLVPRQSIRENLLAVIGSDWNIGRIISPEETVSPSTMVLDGFLLTSASPIFTTKGRLIVNRDQTLSDNVRSSINSTYCPIHFRQRHNPQSVLNRAWDTDSLNTIDIYNLGHGNADYLRGNRSRILYDIGFDYKSFPTPHSTMYARTANALNAMRPSCVILSHWDLDHIIGCVYAEPEVFQVKWIAPSLSANGKHVKSINAIRLARYLNILGNLCLVDRTRPNPLVANIACRNGFQIKLWLGRGQDSKKGHHRISRVNCEGLYIEIIGTANDLHILLSGDVPYKCMQPLSHTPLHILHVPHHCSKMDLTKLHGLPNPTADPASKIGCAIISASRRNAYCPDHYAALQDLFKMVLFTTDNPFGVEDANLRVHIDLRKNTFGIR